MSLHCQRAGEIADRAPCEERDDKPCPFTFLVPFPGEDVCTDREADVMVPSLGTQQPDSPGHVDPQAPYILPDIKTVSLSTHCQSTELCIRGGIQTWPAFILASRVHQWAMSVPAL